jgi:hypothetical protein
VLQAKSNHIAVQLLACAGSMLQMDVQPIQQLLVGLAMVSGHCTWTRTDIMCASW